MSGTWWAKSRGWSRACVGQRDPELHAVQQGGVRRADLGVRDPVPAGHEVELAGADHRVGAEAVAVLDLAGEQPADRREPRVRVRAGRPCRPSSRCRRARSGRRSTRPRSASAAAGAGCGARSSRGVRRGARRAGSGPRHAPPTRRARTAPRRARSRCCSLLDSAPRWQVLGPAARDQRGSGSTSSLGPSSASGSVSSGPANDGACGSPSGTRCSSGTVATSARRPAASSRSAGLLVTSSRT